MEEQQKKGFVVRDRRKIVLDDIESKETEASAKKTAEETEPQKPQEPSSQEKAKTEADQAGRKTESIGTYPQVTFSTFVFSLSSSALVHLGEVPDPSTQKVEKDLPLAKQIIDTLAMLQEKTKGNLDKDEEQLLQTVLYDLRLRFVKQCGS
ncbi:MAG: DUF1844 domain-containing protein [Desulfosoma sp.]